ncbi:GntR family transcriptional regulator [Pseudoduganella umbonata]|uniref:GntR family transcriptional regulator n=1 Tax=Pseudoduganella umbonata TaxID=864828 RepID=A0A4P8HIR7_9BURK|nr:GntR family transcriptional regulator [Pseudoduganella umbonata]MBB3219487.1 DNA-binding GntR family transcriptional regulator [Pseudoduganella umbonata]QCP09569.1 GntR family transcriptional regulator [Pseudoduganella umbonata]
MSEHTLPGSFRLDRSRSAAAQVYEHLRELIVTLALPPGAVLSRNDLAGYFDVSVTPVRDALARLDEEKLVEVFPQHATRVRAVDLSSAREAHFLRLSVELELVHGLAVRCDAALAARLLALVDRQRTCLERDDLASFTALDMEFHRTMYDAALLTGLWHRLRDGSGNLDRLRRLHLPLNGKAQSILEQHAEIARAIGDGDPARAQSWVRAHLSGTLSELDALRERYPDFVLPVP